MPRAFSISIQSETVARRPALPCTAPASEMTLGVQRERLGERGLAGVGVGDHREGPAAGGLAQHGAVEPLLGGVVIVSEVICPGLPIASAG